MAGIRDETRKLFPVDNVRAILKIFRSELEGDHEPNLTVLSVVVGMVENILTSNRASSQGQAADENRMCIEPIFPVIELPNVEALCAKFEAQVKGSVDLSDYKSEFATREMVKKVSDIIWSSLSRAYYKDKAHLQSLFSYLTGNQLDCFGVALAVVAACQILNFKDVHLALSEDHAWVVFGENGEGTAEVTWHGKGNEDKRGQPVSMGITEKSWLYLNGFPVVCTRHMEIAALVSAINPTISSSLDSIELASLQQELLWSLYDMGHLKKYPLALSNLGDLESIDPTPDRPTTLELFEEAIQAGKEFYSDHHVYPYTYLGGHLYRQKQYKRAMQYWAEGAKVLSQYNYQREDEEVYKEFLEVANELIPTILKQATVYHSRDARHIPKDPECYGFYLRLYDNICKWEEGSSTPVLHITWAKHFVASVTKFDSSIRDRLDVRLIDAEGKEEVEEKDKDNEEEMKEEEDEEEESESKKAVNDKEEDINKNVVSAPDEADGCGKKGKAENEGERSEDNINPELFSDPFAGTGLLWDTKTEFSDFLSTRSNGSAFPGMTLESLMKAESPAEMAFQRRLKSQLSQDDNDNAQGQSDSKQNEEGDDEDDETKDELEDSINLPPQPVPKILLRSAKMKGLRGILTSTSKLNTAAIHLQLTAQSQVQVGKRIRSTNDYEDYGTLRRRPRRE
ncbi:menin [Strongylocentrotus purpuratus]|uniref:Menin n=1 Tax=Strongylocentrotus purpuratus TaxID=7668 RepID=A0A7M7RH13_STRPU|nr:menin [Strongylocentrotus purpuratus]|eukprot:XP_794534.2 PREDICTED: menin [Strongylocentrotus purpuratus]